MQDTSSAANHRRADRAYQSNGLGSDQSAAEETWFEVVPAPPRDTPLIALIPVPREESPSAG
jgi:hypothetical protein